VKVVLVSGIWPPDVGGPASHATEVAEFLAGRGHRVEVITTAATEPAPETYPVRWVSRTLPKGAIHARTGFEVARRAAGADVVYTTGMFARSAGGAVLARRPYVVKLTGDPAFERLRWRGRVTGGVEEFQRDDGGLEARALRALRDVTLRRAAHVICPSEYLRRLVVSFGVDPDGVSVLPNPVPPPHEQPPREALRARFGMDGPTLAFAGRLGPQKALDVGIAAVAAADGVSLVVAGDGEDRARLEASAGPRVRFLGSLPRTEVSELFAAADGSLLSSSWENFPHALVEALAVGTPVIATRVGGVPEVVDDGVNGLLVEPGDVEGLAAAIRRFFADAELRERLRAGSVPSVTRYAPDLVYGQLEDILRRCAR
jgi:glycosyltransferase involved in cell wall biosynthesis